MIFSVNRNSPIPLYIQVRDALQAYIQGGTWQPGDRLPGEPELCRLFSVSQIVIRQALSDLVHKGLVVREQGKGTFVAGPKINEGWIQKLTGFYQDMVERGYTPVTQVLKQQLSPASREVAGHLHIEPGTQVIEIERLRFVQNEPLSLVTSYIPYALCPPLLSEDLSNQSLYAFLKQQCDLMIARGNRSIEAVPASDYQARLLGIKKGAPLIWLESISYLSDGTPVEYYYALHRGDRSRFEVELIRLHE